MNKIILTLAAVLVINGFACSDVGASTANPITNTAPSDTLNSAFTMSPDICEKLIDNVTAQFQLHKTNSKVRKKADGDADCRHTCSPADDS
jgi:hypothetical protein